MKNLDSIFSQIATEVNNLKIARATEEKTIEEEYGQKINALQKEINILEGVKKRKFNKINSAYETSENELRNTSYKKYYNALIQDLKEDNQTLQRMYQYSELSQETLTDAIKIQEALKDQKDMDLILKNLNPEISALVKNPDLLKINEKKEIFSYVFVDNKNCYILTPIKEISDKSKLADDLENKFLGMLDKGKKVSLSPEKNMEINDAEFNYKNEYLIIEIPSNNSNDLAKVIIERLNNDKFTPEGLKRCNIIHKARGLDYNILKEFENELLNNEEKPHLSERKSKYDVNEIYGEIKKLRKKYGDNLSMPQIKEELGSKLYFKIDSMRRKGNPEMLTIKAGERGRKKSNL